MSAPKSKSNVVTAFVMDFETGGLDCTKHAATQLSIHAVRMDTFEVMDKMNIYFYPYPYQETVKKKTLKSKFDIQEPKMMEYDKKAEEVSGITMDILESKGIQLTDACNQILDFMKRNTLEVSRSTKPILVGQNILFDIGFLTQIMVYSGLWGELCKLLRGTKDFWGNFQPYYIDTIELAQQALDHRDNIEKWNLGTLCEILGIILEDAHDADADTTATYEIFRLLTSRMRNEDSDGGCDSMVGASKKEKTREHFKI